jgi:hypothetical protein
VVGCAYHFGGEFVIQESVGVSARSFSYVYRSRQRARLYEVVCRRGREIGRIPNDDKVLGSATVAWSRRSRRLMVARRS